MMMKMKMKMKMELLRMKIGNIATQSPRFICKQTATAKRVQLMLRTPNSKMWFCMTNLCSVYPT
jgi:hypothetical protein